MSTTPPQPTTRRPVTRPNWGVAVVVLLAVNIVADLVLGRNGVTGVEAVVLAVLWIAWWALVVVTVVAAVRRAGGRGRTG